MKVNLLKSMWVIFLQSSKISKFIKNTQYVKYVMWEGDNYKVLYQFM